MHDLIIIGGPAALSAAFYALDTQLDAVMIYEDLGGNIGWRECLVGHRQHQHQSERTRPVQQALSRAQPQTGPYLPANDVTSPPGLFAAADVTPAPGEQVFVAIGDGARAAMSAYEYCLLRRLAQVGGRRA